MPAALRRGNRVEDRLRSVEPPAAWVLEGAVPDLCGPATRSRRSGRRRGRQERAADGLLGVDGTILGIIEPFRGPEHLRLPALAELPDADGLHELVADPVRGVEGVDRLLEDHADARA